MITARSASRRAAMLAVVSLACLIGGPSCNNGEGLLRAKIIESRAERVGGPVAMADVGDYLLENDQIRVAVLRAIDSPGPGPYGGSIVDMDLRRPIIGTEGENGHDRFAESFPLANLLVPDPTATEVTVLKDGSDGEEAAIRVEGEGGFFMQALSVLRTEQAGLDIYFPNVHTKLHFTTDYILHPGDRHLLLRTTLRLGDEVPEGCALPESCPVECPNGYSLDPTTGCLTCECSDVLPLDLYTGPAPVFRGLLGDAAGDATREIRAGVVAGDFVFFGNQNDVFVPGPGFDETWAVQTAFNEGRNTFQDPLSYDFVAAAGKDVSYAYFTVAPPGAPPPQVNVPLITSAATAFLSHYKNCLWSSSDDQVCDRQRTFTYERYLGVGEGDVASVVAEMYRLRGTPVGEVHGLVTWMETGEAAPHAEVHIFTDPEPGRAWTSVDELVNANLVASGAFGLVNEIDCDVGLDPVEDGDFHGQLPPGRYVAVAEAKDSSSVSPPVSFQVVEGSSTVVVPTLPTAARIAYRVTDESGVDVPAKVVLLALDANGQVMEGDAHRRPYLGNTRLGTGRQTLAFTTIGDGEVKVQPGRYRAVASRGPEYSIYTEDFDLGPGQKGVLDAHLIHEVDTTGWMSIDTHLHSTMSFDSGLPLNDRVAACTAEGLDIAVATDHDVITDYRPYVLQQRLEPYLQTAIGEEISTLDQGHFIGFPLRYDALQVPANGAYDWTCQSANNIMDWIRTAQGDVNTLTIVAHPRDGFLGYMSQLGVDTYTMNRSTSLFESANTQFRTATCNFAAMEVFNAKRFELIRTPSVSEIVDWNRCVERLNAATTIDELAVACPEMSAGLAAPCSDTERFADCRERVRTALAWLGIKRILLRTPEEQNANWDFPGKTADSQALCDSTVINSDTVDPATLDQPCTVRPGHVDDFFRLLEHGMAPTQLGGSDSHGHDKEPAYPRTYFRADSDNPLALPLDQAVSAIQRANAFATYGPFIRAKLRDKSYGEVVPATPGESVSLELQVQTASWFGVDRVEVYVNGRLERVVEPTSATSDIIDVDGKVTFTVPDRDSWVIVIAMGLQDRNLMRSVVLDLPYGELELSRIASDAFSRIPAVASIFPPPVSVPSWEPLVPYAMTNPIYLDTNGNGRYDAPLPAPDFCPRPCDPSIADASQCPTGQECLEKERVCGFNITGGCVPRRAYP